MVAHLNTETGANLELPLSRHDLGIGAGDLDTSIKTLQKWSAWLSSQPISRLLANAYSLVVCVHDVTLDHLSGAHTAVVRSLGRGVTILGPAVWVVVQVQEGVLLLQSEPGLLFGMCLHQLGRIVAVVELVRRPVGIEALAEDENVVTADCAEGVGEDGYGLEEDVGVVAGCLA